MKSIIGVPKALSVGVMGILMLVWACAPVPRCMSPDNQEARSQPYRTQTPPRYTSRTEPPPSYTSRTQTPLRYKSPTYAPPRDRVSSAYMEEGICSFSGQEQHGTRMANGEVFNMHGMVAAHKTLPFGTVVRVTNLSNSRSVLVEIKDRGPFVRGRIIDVSLGAAKKLDMVNAGIVPVKIEIVSGELPQTIEEKPDILDIAKAKFDELVEKIINRNQ